MQIAFSRSLEEMFLTAVPIVLVAGVLALFIKEVPLGTRQDPAGQDPVGQEDGPEVPASSRSATSSPEVPTGSVSGSSSAASSGSSPTSV